MRITRVALASTLLLTTPGCHLDWNERVTGTMIGTAGGALAGGVLGSAVGSTAGGAVLGAVAGGAAGYIIGDYMADQRERSCGCAPAESPCAAPPPPVCQGVRGGVGAETGARAAARKEYEAGRHAITADEALAHYAAAIRLDPSSPEPYNARGLVLLYGNRKAEARQSFQSALAADPTYKPAEANLRRMGGL